MDIPSCSNLDRSLKRGRSRISSLVDTDIRGSSIMTGTPTSLSSGSLSYSSYRPSSYQSPSSHSSSYVAKFQHNYMRDFTCCGSLLPTLHDLLQHYEEKHAQTESSFDAPAKPVLNEALLILNDVLLQVSEEEQAPTQSSFDTAAETLLDEALLILNDVLLQFLAEKQASIQSSFDTAAETLLNEALLILNDVLLPFLEEKQASIQSSFDTAAKTVQKDTIQSLLKHFLILGEISLPRGSPPSLMESIQPDLDPVPENSSHTTTEAATITLRDSGKGTASSDSVDGIRKAFGGLNPFSPLHEDKPFKYPVIECEKAYENQNELRYYQSHDHITYVLHPNEDGTYSVVNPTSDEYRDWNRKQMPDKCNVCCKRCKDQRGLRYHKQHSPLCTINLATPASTPPVEKPKLTVKRQIPPKSNIEPTSNTVDPQSIISNSTNKKQKLATSPIFQCQICDKTFTRATGLSEHRLRHANERPFTCSALEGCEQKFFSRKDCKRHEGIHSGEKKKFICESVAHDGLKIGCGREFGRADHLAAHWRTEAGRICVLGRDEKLEFVDEELV